MKHFFTLLFPIVFLVACAGQPSTEAVRKPTEEASWSEALKNGSPGAFLVFISLYSRSSHLEEALARARAQKAPKESTEQVILNLWSSFIENFTAHRQIEEPTNLDFKLINPQFTRGVRCLIQEAVIKTNATPPVFKYGRGSFIVAQTDEGALFVVYDGVDWWKF